MAPVKLPSLIRKTLAAGTPLDAQIGGSWPLVRRLSGRVIEATPTSYRGATTYPASGARHLGQAEDVMAGNHFALIGPTASGKSALALEIARRFGDIELVSVDSMQVYRGMDIGTAKPSAAERAEIPHHVIDVVEPDQDFAFTEFVEIVQEAIAGIESRGNRALLVGGTGLYLRAVVDGMKPPGRFPEARAQLENESDTRLLHKRLAELDPVAASRMEPDNRRRVVRALEVTIGSGRPFSSFGAGFDAYPETKIRMFGVWLPRDAGRERIDKRVDEMIHQGLVAEVERLQEQFKLSRTARQALGYKEILEGLHTGDIEAAIEKIKQRTRSFARRQRVWFRRDPRISWFGTARDPAVLLPALLRELGRTCEPDQGNLEAQ